MSKLCSLLRPSEHQERGPDVSPRCPGRSNPERLIFCFFSEGPKCFFSLFGGPSKPTNYACEAFFTSKLFKQLLNSLTPPRRSVIKSAATLVEAELEVTTVLQLVEALRHPFFGTLTPQLDLQCHFWHVLSRTFGGHREPWLDQAGPVLPQTLDEWCAPVRPSAWQKSNICSLSELC